MTEGSPHYQTLIEIASSKEFDWSTCVLAGRGITAYARANDWMLREGKKTADPLWLADRMIEFGGAVERLTMLWADFRQGVIPAADFNAEFEQIVERLEGWLSDE